MRFWDSSALVPLLVEEEVTKELLRLYSTDEIVAWWGTDVECTSAVARLERSGQLGVADTTEALRRLRELASSWHLVP